MLPSRKAEAMDELHSFIQRSAVDIWSVIENSIILAHTDHFDQLRLRRDGFAELMFAPRIPRGSDGGFDRKGPSDKATASRDVYKARREDNEDFGRVPRQVKDEVEDQDEEDEEDKDEDEQDGHGDGAHDDEEQRQGVLIGSDSEDEEPAAQDAVARDIFDEDMEALTDDIEREKLLLNEIYSIKNTIDSLPIGRFMPEDEAMDILYRIQGLDISVKVLKETNIGKSVGRYRKHPSKAVVAKTRETVSNWRTLVDEYLDSVRVSSASANEDAGPVAEEEVGLPSPPLDEDGLVAARTMELSDVFNFSESDLSAASGPSPASDGLSVQRGGPSIQQSGRKSSSSPDQEFAAQQAKGVGRVVKVDKHRPVHMEAKPNQYHATTSSASVRKGPNVGSGVRPNSGSNAAAASRTAAGPSAPQRQQLSAAAVRRADERPTPSVGGIKPRVETTKPGLATRVEPLSSDVSARMEASKRKLHANYTMIENAKKMRTVQPLELTELPKGGPKAQRPGQQRGWVKAK